MRWYPNHDGKRHERARANRHRISDDLLTLIKQKAGEFRGGDDESYGVVRTLPEQYEFNKRGDAVSFVSKLSDKIVAAAAETGGKAPIGIRTLLRKGKSSSPTVATLIHDRIVPLPAPYVDY